MIVDDHPLIRDSLAQLINAEKDLEVNGQASNYTEALAQFSRLLPDAAIVDIGLQDVSGMELIREIKIRSPQTRVLVLSMFDETVYASKCLQAGARGYVMKSEPPMTILDALRSVLAGDVYVSPILTNQILRQVVEDATAKPSSIVERLSHRELEVFQMLGHGLSSVHIARRLNLSRKTIQTYREHIKAKLEISHASELIHRATQWVQVEKQTGKIGAEKTADKASGPSQGRKGK